MLFSKHMIGRDFSIKPMMRLMRAGKDIGTLERISDFQMAPPLMRIMFPFASLKDTLFVPRSECRSECP